MPSGQLVHRAVERERGWEVAGFEVERETPFIVQHVARVTTAPWPGSLVNHAVDGAAAQELVVLLIDQHTHGQLVDGRDLNRRCARELDTAEA